MHFKRLFPAVLVGLIATVCSAVPVVRRAGGDERPLPKTQPTTGTVTTPDGSVLGYSLYNAAKTSGTPVILVCGLFQLQADWEHAIPYFNDDHPASSVTNYSLVTMENMVQDIQHLTQHFGWKSINLVGISMGSIISQQFAANYTGADLTLEHLVLIASAYKTGVGSPLNTMVGQWLNTTTLPPTDAQWSQFEDMLFQACLTPEYIRDHAERTQEFLKEIHAAGPNRSFQAFIAQSKDIGHYDFTELLKTIDTPTLILHGGEDIALLPDNGPMIHSLIPGSQFIAYPDGGHILYETDPQCLEPIANFLNQ
ncbi:hypothetical protein BGX31_009649 [Mortierella sp. GBA43]|nr:hypothetical protein BGX31_009649 [Mortierella sp. GBA43]